MSSVRGDPLHGIVCLAGPTAAGKTAAAMAIAHALRGRVAVEVVSVDSALVYRGMDIGTAKPSPDERTQVPHHLIDLIDPAQSYSAARFIADAHAAIATIRTRGAVPLLAGGTMLYFKSLFDGLDTMPAIDPAVRAALAAQCARDGVQAMHRELARVDPDSAERLAPGDTQRVLRALEVWRSSGKPLSAWQRGRPGRSGLAGHTMPPMIALEPADRAWLHARIETRWRQMIDAGVLDEVRALRVRGDLHADLTSMRCVGYRQAWQALDALDAGTSDALDTLAERAVAATRQLAKRQLTWLRSMPERQVLACDASDAIERIVALAVPLIERAAPR